MVENSLAAAYERWIANLAEIATPERQVKDRWRILVRQDRNTFQVYARSRSGEKLLGSIPIEARNEDVVGLRRLIEKHGGRAANSTLLRLSPESVVERIIQIPKAASDVLAPVIGNQIERITPWPEHETCYGFTMIGDSEVAADSFDVRVAATSRALLNSTIDAVKVLGIDPTTVEYEPSSGDGSIALISSEPDRRRKAESRIRSLLALLVLAGASAAAVGGYWAYAQIGENATLVAKVQAAKTRAADVQRLSEQNDQLRKQSQLLIERKSATPAAIQLIEVVSRTLPDTAYLTDFEIHGDEARIAGKSDDPTSLITVLEATPELENIRFAAPTTREERETKATFSIVGRVASAAKQGVAP